MDLMNKDFCALMYISNYLTSTAEMDGDCVGWYTRLLMHHYDKGSVPDDIEQLAKLAGVKFSEFERFKQVFEQVLKYKFISDGNGRRLNPKAEEILSERQSFKEKRSKSGLIGAIMKRLRQKQNWSKEEDALIKQHFYEMEIEDLKKVSDDIKEPAKIKHLLKHLVKLYIDIDRDKDIVYNSKYTFENFWNDYDKKVERPKCEAKYKKISEAERVKIKAYLPKYKAAQPDKQFRKNPYTFLNNESWNDELVGKQETEQKQVYRPPQDNDWNKIFEE